MTRAPGPRQSGAMLDVETDRRPTAAPSRRWRNYYRVYRVLHLARVGHVFPGIHPGPDVFPSQEIAEQRALVFLKMLNSPGRFLMDYVAAFPEGEAAN